MGLLLLIILLASVTWFVLDRFGKAPREQVAAARRSAQRSAKQLGDSSQTTLSKLRGRFDRRSDQQAFTQWIAGLVAALPAQSAETNAFTAWLEASDAAELRTFRAKLLKFCETFKIEQKWLQGDTLADRPELRHSLEESVALYALAYARGAAQQNDIARTQAFQRWNAAPNSGSQRALGAKLFSALVQEGLVTPSAEIMLAAERQRRDFANQAIRTAASEHPQRFDAILANVLAAPNKALPAPAATPVEAGS